MKLRTEQIPFLAFTAVFAVLAGFVFWGTWSCDVAPVMPDHPLTWPAHYGARLAAWWEGFRASGKWTPFELFSLVGSPYLWQEFKYALALYLSGLGLAWTLQGPGFKLSPVASYGAGLLLAFSGYWCTLFSAGHYGWFQWMAFGLWPFGIIDRAFAVNEGARSKEQGASAVYWILLGACLAWGSMFQPDLWLLFTVFTFAYFVFRFVQGRCYQWVRLQSRLLGMVLALLVFFLIGGASFYSAIVNDLAGRDQQIAEGQTITEGARSKEQGASKDEEARKRWIFVTNWSLPPEETLEFVWPRVNGDTSCPLTLSMARRSGKDTRPYTGAIGRPLVAKSGNYRQHAIYVGLVTCILALLGVGGIIKGVRSKEQGVSVVIFFLVAAIVFYLFSLGRYCEGVYRLVYALPMGDYLRAPVKWHHLTELCLVVLAAFGLDYLENILEKKFHNHSPFTIHLSPATIATAIVALLGAADLARIDHLYCAPVKLGDAEARNCNLSLQIAEVRALSNPQVQELMRRGSFIYEAPYALAPSEAAILGILDPIRAPKPAPHPATPLVLGLISVLTSLAVIIYSCRNSFHRLRTFWTSPR